MINLGRLLILTLATGATVATQLSSAAPPTVTVLLGAPPPPSLPCQRGVLFTITHWPSLDVRLSRLCLLLHERATPSSAAACHAELQRWRRDSSHGHDLSARAGQVLSVHVSDRSDIKIDRDARHGPRELSVCPVDPRPGMWSAGESDEVLAACPAIGVTSATACQELVGGVARLVEARSVANERLLSEVQALSASLVFCKDAFYRGLCGDAPWCVDDLLSDDRAAVDDVVGRRCGAAAVRVGGFARARLSTWLLYRVRFYRTDVGSAEHPSHRRRETASRVLAAAAVVLLVATALWMMMGARRGGGRRGKLSSVDGAARKAVVSLEKTRGVVDVLKGAATLGVVYSHTPLFSLVFPAAPALDVQFGGGRFYFPTLTLFANAPSVVALFFVINGFNNMLPVALQPERRGFTCGGSMRTRSKLTFFQDTLRHMLRHVGRRYARVLPPLVLLAPVLLIAAVAAEEDDATAALPFDLLSPAQWIRPVALLLTFTWTLSPETFPLFHLGLWSLGVTMNFACIAFPVLVAGASVLTSQSPPPPPPPRHRTATVDDGDSRDKDGNIIDKDVSRDHNNDGRGGGGNWGVWLSLAGCCLAATLAWRLRGCDDMVMFGIPSRFATRRPSILFYKDSLFGRLDDFIAGMLVARWHARGGRCAGACGAAAGAVLAAAWVGWACVMLDHIQIGSLPFTASALAPMGLTVGFALVLVVSLSVVGGGEGKEEALAEGRAAEETYAGAPLCLYASLCWCHPLPRRCVAACLAALRWVGRRSLVIYLFHGWLIEKSGALHLFVEGDTIAGHTARTGVFVVALLCWCALLGDRLSV